MHFVYVVFVQLILFVIRRRWLSSWTW